jgi:hypothetical protein
VAIAAAFPGAIVQPAGRLRLATTFLVMLALVLVGGVLATPELLIPLSIVGLGILAPIGVLLGWLWHDTPPAGGEVEVRPEGIFVRGKLAVPRAHVKQALVARATEGFTVVLQRRLSAGTVITVPDEATGHRFVAAMGLDPVTAVSSFRFESLVLARRPKPLVYAYVTLVPLLLLPLFVADAFLIAGPLFLVWYATILLAVMPTKVTVGLDGVEIVWLWRRRLIRFSDIRGCEVHEEGIRLVGREGKDTWISAMWQEKGASSHKALGFDSKRAYLDAVAARIREAAEASRQRRSALATGQLERAARPVAAWVRELRGLLVNRAAGFREGATLPEHLWSAVEDTQAPAEIRAAAAAALAPTLDPEGRQRLRVVAAVALTPGLRVALEAAAAQDDQALEAAMNSVVQLEERAVLARDT